MRFLHSKKFLVLVFLSFFVKQISANAQITSLPLIEAERWYNSSALSTEELKGHPVLVEFWTFACNNCQNVEPHIKELYHKYRDKGLKVIAVHSPEMDMERDPERLKKYLATHEINYPVAVDNDFKIWKKFGVGAWPSIFLADKDLTIRYLHVGEGDYDTLEKKIQELSK